MKLLKNLNLLKLSLPTLLLASSLASPCFGAEKRFDDQEAWFSAEEELHPAKREPVERMEVVEAPAGKQLERSECIPQPMNIEAPESLDITQEATQTPFLKFP